MSKLRIIKINEKLGKQWVDGNTPFDIRFIHPDFKDHPLFPKFDGIPIKFIDPAFLLYWHGHKIKDQGMITYYPFREYVKANKNEILQRFKDGQTDSTIDHTVCTLGNVRIDPTPICPNAEYLILVLTGTIIVQVMNLPLSIILVL